MHDVLVREEQPGDGDGIRALLMETFESDAEARLVEALRSSDGLIAAHVAELDGKLVGYIALSPVTIDGLVVGVGLAPLAVAKRCEGTGIGTQLATQCLEMARGLAYSNAFVLGAPKFYSKLGFRPADTFQVRSLYASGDAFQALELRAGGMPPSGGTIRYSEAFEAVFPV